MESSELIPYFALLVCAAFALSIKPSLSQPKSFQLLLFWLSLSLHWGGSEPATG